MEKCYLCEKGILEKKKVDYPLHGISLGKFEAETCNQCGEIFFDENTSRKMTKIAKEKGLFGLEAETKVTLAGNSLAIRIPKKIADFMHLKKGDNTRLYPEADKLIIEFK
mgnify:CR=1 FL=1